MLSEAIKKKLDKGNARSVSRGFTPKYQNEREQEDNTIYHKELALAERLYPLIVQYDQLVTCNIGDGKATIVVVVDVPKRLPSAPCLGHPYCA